jgi:hypothetical protein
MRKKTQISREKMLLNVTKQVGITLLQHNAEMH